MRGAIAGVMANDRKAASRRRWLVFGGHGLAGLLLTAAFAVAALPALASAGQCGADPSRPRNQCVLAALLEEASGGRDTLSLSVAGGARQLEAEDTLSIAVTLPAGSHYLYIAHISADGSVTPIESGARYAGGSSVRFGDGTPGKGSFYVGPPFGPDMVIAVASERPLTVEAPGTAQTLEAFLPRLDAGLRRAGRVRAASVFFTTYSGRQQ